MFSATLSVGASVNSWLTDTMPSSSASFGEPIVRSRAVDLDAAGVGSERAGGDARERRLARPVLARERVNRRRRGA